MAKFTFKHVRSYKQTFCSKVSRDLKHLVALKTFSFHDLSDAQVVDVADIFAISYLRGNFFCEQLLQQDECANLGKNSAIADFFAKSFIVPAVVACNWMARKQGIQQGFVARNLATVMENVERSLCAIDEWSEDGANIVTWTWDLIFNSRSFMDRIKGWGEIRQCNVFGCVEYRI